MASSASGTGSVAITPGSTTVQVSLTLNGVVGQSAAHLHVGGEEEAQGEGSQAHGATVTVVDVFICHCFGLCLMVAAASGTSGPVACSLPSGSFENAPCALSEQQFAALRAGAVYFNVHTSAHPDGKLSCHSRVSPAAVCR